MIIIQIYLILYQKKYGQYVLQKTSEYQKKYGFEIGTGKEATHNN